MSMYIGIPARDEGKAAEELRYVGVWIFGCVVLKREGVYMYNFVRKVWR